MDEKNRLCSGVMVNGCLADRTRFWQWIVRAVWTHDVYWSKFRVFASYFFYSINKHKLSHFTLRCINAVPTIIVFRVERMKISEREKRNYTNEAEIDIGGWWLHTLTQNMCSCFATTSISLLRRQSVADKNRCEIIRHWYFIIYFLGRQIQMSIRNLCDAVAIALPSCNAVKFILRCVFSFRFHIFRTSQINISMCFILIWTKKRSRINKKRVYRFENDALNTHTACKKKWKERVK